MRQWHLRRDRGAQCSKSMDFHLFSLGALYELEEVVYYRKITSSLSDCLIVCVNTQFDHYYLIWHQFSTYLTFSTYCW